jgi:CheY-like chemotaxis protein
MPATLEQSLTDAKLRPPRTLSNASPISNRPQGKTISTLRQRHFLDPTFPRPHKQAQLPIFSFRTLQQLSFAVEDQDFRTTFLILEDDANDALLIRRAFTSAACRAFVCRNTSEARAYLVGAGMYANRDHYQFPDIFITDLRLADESGMQFLGWLRSKPEFKDLPVIILSCSTSPKDMAEAKKLGVSRFIQKPGNPGELEMLVIKLSRQFSPRDSEHITKPQDQSAARQHAHHSH